MAQSGATATTPTLYQGVLAPEALWGLWVPQGAATTLEIHVEVTPSDHPSPGKEAEQLSLPTR